MNPKIVTKLTEGKHVKMNDPKVINMTYNEKRSLNILYRKMML